MGSSEIWIKSTTRTCGQSFHCSSRMALFTRQNETTYETVCRFQCLGRNRFCGTKCMCIDTAYCIGVAAHDITVTANRSSENPACWHKSFNALVFVLLPLPGAFGFNGHPPQTLAPSHIGAHVVPCAGCLILRHDLSRWCCGDLVPDVGGGRQLGTDTCSEIPHAGLRFDSWTTTCFCAPQFHFSA